MLVIDFTGSHRALCRSSVYLASGSDNSGAEGGYSQAKPLSAVFMGLDWVGNWFALDLISGRDIVPPRFKPHPKKRAGGRRPFSRSSVLVPRASSQTTQDKSP